MRHLGTEIVIEAYSNRVLQVEIRIPAATAELAQDDLDTIREAYLAKLADVPGAV